MPESESIANAGDVVDLEQRKRRNRWDEVIEASVELFWLQGYGASRVQEVADKVGVLKGSLYHYIRTKEDLLFHIVEDVHRESREILGIVQTLDVSPLERLATYIERHVVWFLTCYKQASVYFSEWRYLTDQRLEQARVYRRSYDAIIRRMVADAQASNQIPEALDPKYAAFFLHSAINGMSDWFSPEGPDPVETVAANYTAMAVAVLVGWQPVRPRFDTPAVSPLSATPRISDAVIESNGSNESTLTVRFEW